MPFKSQAQRRKFAELLVKGEISNETFEEWNRETGGRKLPGARQEKTVQKAHNKGPKAKSAAITPIAGGHMHVSNRGAAAVAAIILAGCAATLVAQATDAGAGSLGELTSEIRQLRFAIEQSSRTQTQAQALGIFLSAQQSRILQVTTRLDTARKELDTIARQSTAPRQSVGVYSKSRSRKYPIPTSAPRFEDRSKGLKLEMKAVAAQEQQARTHEAEMLQAWQQEEARWNDLIARLQQIVER